MGQWGLARRRVVRSELPLRQCDKHYSDEPDRDPSSSVHRHGLWQPIGDQAGQDLGKQGH